VLEYWPAVQFVQFPMLMAPDALEYWPAVQFEQVRLDTAAMTDE